MYRPFANRSPSIWRSCRARLYIQNCLNAQIFKDEHFLTKRFKDPDTQKKRHEDLLLSSTAHRRSGPKTAQELKDGSWACRQEKLEPLVTRAITSPKDPNSTSYFARIHSKSTKKMSRMGKVLSKISARPKALLQRSSAAISLHATSQN